MTPEARELYGLYWTFSSGLTNEELASRNSLVRAAKEEKRDEAHKWASDILLRKIQDELESFTTEDVFGNTRATPRCALTQEPYLMRLWSVPDEKLKGDDLLETELECANLADEIFAKLMLYRAKRAHAARVRDGEPVIPTTVDDEILRMVDIATKEEDGLRNVAHLSGVIGLIPAECCPEAAPYFELGPAAVENGRTILAK